MNNSPKNFADCIHNEAYDCKYYEKMITANDMFYDSGRERELLNGQWHFQIDMFDTCLRAKWFEEKYKSEEERFLPVDFSFEQWEKIKVPACWNMENDKFYYYEGPGLYFRTFNYIPKGQERVFIKFGAVNYAAKVFLNKKYIGMHLGGSTPFFLEVTGMLEETNRLLVVADNTRKSTSVPCRNFDWFNYGGIYRDVELIRVPETFIKDFSLCLVPDSNFKKLQARVLVQGSNIDGEVQVFIPELGINRKIVLVNGEGSTFIEAEPELWSPENPKLYDVRLTYIQDAINEKIGFREIKVTGTNILLNGKSINLKGVCCHEESLDNGKAVTEEEIRENFRLAKEMNCNYMRLAHYTHTEKAARIADEMGIMLWEEIPVYWAVDFSNKDTYRDAENQMIEMIKRDINRVSVVIWSVGNENADTEARLRFMSSLAEKAREMDSTRLVSAACLVDHVDLIIKDRLAEYLDIIGINEYYGWYQPNFEELEELLENSKPEKPVVITEFGADALAGARGTVNDLGTEDCQLEIYRKQVEVLGQIPYIKGTTPWILYDFRSPKRTSELQLGYNTKGLLSKDKKYRKPSFYVMQKFYEGR